MFCNIDELIIPRGMTCVIGSGGKTSFLRFLSDTLPGTVILTTSTHMFPFEGIPLIDTDRSCSVRQIREALSVNHTVCVGALLRNDKLGSPSETISFEELTELADHVIVEADGSRGLPLKAHRSFEPVIPSCSALTIGMIGASGIGRPMRDVCHCPELFASLAGTAQDTIVEPEHIARVINQEDLADVYFINKCDVLPDLQTVRLLSSLINKNTFAGSIALQHFLTADQLQDASGDASCLV